MAEKNSIVLRQVKQCLIDDGWQKGTLGGVDHPHCVLGAFAIVHGWEPNTYIETNDWTDDWFVDEESIYWHSDAAQAFWGCLSQADYEHWGAVEADAIVNWNDKDERRLDDVLDELEKCAQAEEAAGR